MWRASSQWDHGGLDRSSEFVQAQGPMSHSVTRLKGVLKSNDVKVRAGLKLVRVESSDELSVFIKVALFFTRWAMVSLPSRTRYMEVVIGNNGRYTMHSV
jgi:hypothetical protein